MKKVKLTIEGMHCASCASNIERSLKKVEGVGNVSVSVMTKKSFVEVDDKVSDDALKQAVARAGYKIINIERN